MLKKFLLVSIIPQGVDDEQIFQELSELKSLVESSGGKVMDVILQRREVHDKGPYIGTGKIVEAGEVIREKKIDVVVLNGIIKPGHLYDMKSDLSRVNRSIEVWDRVDLILEIFSLHAKTAEARLQIQLAAMRHMGPRIYGMGMVLSRQSGGIGSRGIGETNTERMKRHWREQKKKTEEKLKKLALEREQQLIRREKNGLRTISIVGYTNVGKTTLFNRLSGKKKYTKDELFATLDSTVGKVYLPAAKQEILLSDTIGFIQNLPAELIEAFTSTLLESAHADVLLHVIDASDPMLPKKIELVEEILHGLTSEDTPRIYVFNKIDLLSQEEITVIRERYAAYSPQFISLKDDQGIPALLQTMNTVVFERIEEKYLL